MNVQVLTDLDACRRIWRQVMPRTDLTGLWSVRSCFDRQYRRPLHFIVVEDRGRLVGFAPLCQIEETGGYGFFPGETWRGRTWLEKNRLLFENDDVYRVLLDNLPSGTDLRYLDQESIPDVVAGQVDETGYLFHPPRHGYDPRGYLAKFPGKTIRKMRREIDRLTGLGVEYCYNRPEDVDLMIRINRDQFGAESYFHDGRFRNAFRNLADHLAQTGRLRVTTLLLGGRTAAVDLGAIYNGVYTVLAGAAAAGFPGAAKLINLHHLSEACRLRLDEVDFLCGDFNWKKRLRLTERPLYRLSSPADDRAVDDSDVISRVIQPMYA